MKQFNLRHFISMMLGIVCIGAGIGLFNVSLMGADPYSALALGVGNILHWEFSISLFLINTICFSIEFLLLRKYIGLGTFMNWTLTGLIAGLCSNFIYSLMTIPECFFGRLPFLILGIILLSLGISLYQVANMGISPYDSMSLIIQEKTSFNYFWCRMIVDGICCIIGYLLGCPIGIGTLICAFGLGSIIEFFNKTISKKICGTVE